MPANASFPNLIDVEEGLIRLARNTHGALSILGSTSLEQLGGSDIARDRISERGRVWQAYVLDARRLLLAAGDEECVRGALDRLDSTIDELTAAYVNLVSVHSLTSSAVDELRSRFPVVYRDLQSVLSDLGISLGIDLSFPGRLNSLRRTCFERSLRWLDDELSRIAKDACTSTT